MAKEIVIDSEDVINEQREIISNLQHENLVLRLTIRKMQQEQKQEEPTEK